MRESRRRGGGNEGRGEGREEKREGGNVGMRGGG